MKTQLDELLTREYSVTLWRIKCRLIHVCGSQKNAAKILGIDEGNLSKILSGVVDCNSRLFFRLLSLSQFVIISNDPLPGF